MKTVFHPRLYGRFIEIQSNHRRNKLHTTNQGSNFLGGTFSNRDNVRAPIQFIRERLPQHLKRWFFLKNRLINFHTNSTHVNKPIKKKSWAFPELKSTSHFLLQSIVSHRSDSSSRINSSCYHWSDVWSNLE